ncbi:MAG: capsular polysaccharide export protein, LipB/KpsS family, partial [Albimonas sp.]|uniref:capsular polysaccharide export protein, LipB/KpsS family n=1 Tax=Albimonas sp. TaxID=1872425 RepID=UPI0040572329
RRLIELGITKYNLARSAPLPQTSRQRILVPGQVEGDQSLKFGSPEVQENAELLRRVRARHPDAFILYKPHPDVLTGLRPGAVDARTLAECADAVATESAAEACLEWADRVECMTSLMGFEALLRDLPVTTFGRPFYAGWGLTETPFDPAYTRGRTLSIDALAACALILYPRYVDPVTRLPAPPEKVLEWLHAERDYVKTPRGRAREAWRGLASRALNALR